MKDCKGSEQGPKSTYARTVVVVKAQAQGTEFNAGSSEKVASPIGPAPLYDTNYPYSPNITGNPTPALPAEFAVI